MRALANYHDCGFFVLRSPALPVSRVTSAMEKFSLGDGGDHPFDEDAYRAKMDGMARYLYGLADDASIREALWVASPGLVGRLKEKGVDEVVRDHKMLATLYKYLVRMASRCTPFGLFASFTLGQTSDTTQLESTEKPIERRATRVDAEYVYRLVSHINSNKAIRNSIRYRANTGLYRIGKRVHYAETRATAGGNGISYDLSAVEVTDYLMAVLESAASPVCVSRLVQTVCDIDSDVEHDEASDYIHELIDNQLLMPEITPAVTGGRLLPAVVDGLRGIPAAEELSNVLIHAIDLLDRPDTDKATTDDYTQVLEKLRELPLKINEQHLFQVDANRQFDAMIGQDVLDEIRRSVDLLHRISRPTSEGPLGEFKRRFMDRYGDQEVSLCEALDVDAGVGFDGGGGSASSMEPLLKGIRGMSAGGNGGLANLASRDVMLAEIVQRMDRDPNVELNLDKKLIERLENAVRQPLPDAWSAFVVMLGGRDDNGSSDSPRIYLKNVTGPGSANLLGRFCHVNSDLEDAVKHCMKAEEKLAPDFVYAEIAHMPEGRIGNVLRRPVLRDHEIVYLCESSVAAEKRINVQDLLVSVQNGQVILKSQLSGKRIIPRLASAHNYHRKDNLGMYRFLCSLQGQGVHGAMYWDWGGLSVLDFLPRVIHQRTILTPASWKIQAKDLTHIIDSTGSRRFEAINKLRNKLNLPRWVLLAEGDNSVRFDLECPLSVDMLADFLRRHKSGVRVSEVLSERFGSPLKINGESYCNETIVPFVRSHQ